MLDKIKTYIEPNKKLKALELFFMCLLLISSLCSFIYGNSRVNKKSSNISFVEEVVLNRTSFDECDEDSTTCEIVYSDGVDELVKTYSYEEYEDVEDEIVAYKYKLEDGTILAFDHKDPTLDEVDYSYKQMMANNCAPIYNFSISCLILLMSIGVIYFLSKAFTTYEKCWFMSIMVLATIVAVLFPEESANGVNGIIIMLLYLLDTYLNILCELLISKQSRYNFLVSVLVEIVEILVCLVLMYRFATIATTLFFWLPIDILSYINWSKHKDDKEDELTSVRRLKGYQEVLIVLVVIVWTFGFGYLLSGLNIKTDFFNGNKDLETLIIYMDACASAVGVANGLFIFFRLREQWLAWYISALLEAIMNILTGQYVLLVLKLGYFTNTTYGYLKWSKYIKEHDEGKKSFF